MVPADGRFLDRPCEVMVDLKEMGRMEGQMSVKGSFCQSFFGL